MANPFTIPAVSEQFLANKSANERLATIIDILLGYAAGSQQSNVSYIAAASANQDSANLVATPVNLKGITAVNVAASVRYLKLYNKANPTSADTPIKVIPIGTGGTISLNVFENFSVVLSSRLTTGFANNDTGTVTAGDVIFTLDYTLTTP